MSSSKPVSGSTPPQSSSTVAGQADPNSAALGPIPQVAQATPNPPLGAAHRDSPAEAEGRRILSTAYVMKGPEGHLVVELRDGRELVLRDVVVGPKDYCGVFVSGGTVGGKFCGGFAEIIGSRPGAPPPRR